MTVSRRMSCEGFSKKTLMGNWYEERLAVDQPVREQPESRQTRGEEEAISYIANNSKVLPLGRIKRNLPWNSKGVMPEDGQKEYRSVYATTYDKINLDNYYKLGDCRNIVKQNTALVPRAEISPNVQTNGATTNHMLTLDNLTEATERMRDVKKNITDFGSTFRQHEENHKRLFDMTSYQASFSRPLAQTAYDVINQHHAKLNAYAGTLDRPLDEMGVKMTSALTGEKYRDKSEPKENTSVQRSWLPFKDKAILVAEDNLKRTQATSTNYKAATNQKLAYDIATSLPLEDGEYTLKSKYNNPGAFRHIRTDVTLIRNKPITKKQLTLCWQIVIAQICMLNDCDISQNLLY
eukprot:TRINITY_DN11816_c0_g1_i1.p1 TRINITY_DN11816_c0_g1~~TRINITY_DN11816_c0_g1_i1.p1  ORF type:complete len:350 (-),score=30.12 TRINITY_DN11816_c0_g1_i1:166-1215(-)